MAVPPSLHDHYLEETFNYSLMKKILFVVCTHGDEQVGKHLYNIRPQGKVDNIEWSVIVGNPEAMFLNQRYTESDLNRVFPGNKNGTYEERRASQILPLVNAADIVIDIHQTRADSTMKDCLFVNSIDRLTLNLCKKFRAKNIVWDWQPDHIKYVTGSHNLGITVEYTRSYNYQEEVSRMMTDVNNILEDGFYENIHQTLWKADRGITHEERGTQELQNNTELTDEQKDFFHLDKSDIYIPIFIGEYPESKYYCFLNKKI